MAKSSFIVVKNCPNFVVCRNHDESVFGSENLFWSNNQWSWFGSEKNVTQISKINKICRKGHNLM